MNSIFDATKDNKNSVPLVSVCLLTYNHKDTIGQAIEGIVSQKTNFKFELIVHDDASTDGTAEIVREYAEKYPHIIRPVFQKENQYRKCNLVKEFVDPIALGKYGAVCEGDDYWTDENKLQCQVDYMESNSNCTMCFHAVEQLNSKGEKMVYRPLKSSGLVPAQTIIARGGLFCPSVSLMFRREAMLEYPEFRIVADVYDYPSQVLASVKGDCYYIDKIMGVYRFAGEGSWTETHSAVTDFRHIENETKWLSLFNEYTNGKYEKAISYHMSHLWFTEYRKKVDRDVRKKAMEYIKHLDFKNRFLFSCLVVMFTVLGTRANAIFNLVKKYLLK